MTICGEPLIVTWILSLSQNPGSASFVSLIYLQSSSLNLTFVYLNSILSYIPPQKYYWKFLVAMKFERPKLRVEQPKSVFAEDNSRWTNKDLDPVPRHERK
jgi:hypothetical protein